MKWVIPLLESSTFFLRNFLFNIDKRSVISESTTLALDNYRSDRFSIKRKALQI